MIENLIVRIAREFPASSGDNLDGFVMDADCYFSQQDAFASAQVERGVGPLSVVNISIILAESVQSLQQVARALEAAWTETRYKHFAASGITWYREATVLRFVTVVSDESYFISGTATASGPRYADLVQAFERDFGSMHGPLPSTESHV